MDEHCESPTRNIRFHGGGGCERPHCRRYCGKACEDSECQDDDNERNHILHECRSVRNRSAHDLRFDKVGSDIVCRCTAEARGLLNSMVEAARYKPEPPRARKSRRWSQIPDEEHVAAGRPCRASFADTTTGSSGAGPESRDASLSSETDVDINRSMKPCGLPTSKTASSATYFQNQRLVTAAISAAVAGNPRLRYPRS